MRRILKIIRDGIIWIAIIPIRIYQYLISPVLPMSCRHAPTCSQYAIEALKVHGIFRGTYLAVHRILRCHPWGTHGYDPVPPKPYRIFKFRGRDENVHTDELNQRGSIKQADKTNIKDKVNSDA